MTSWRERARLWLRGFGKLAAVVLLAGAVGIGLGVAIAALTGDDADAPRAVTDAPAITASVATTPATTPSTASGRPASRPAPLRQIRASVGAAVLHPAAAAAGQRRRRARLGVSVRVENRGSERVVLERPSLLAANQRIPTNAAADAPTTNVGPIAPGRTANAVLQFETAGAVTEQLTTQRRARLHIAGRSVALTIVVGSPVTSGS